ncbi:flagellar motor switch protein FliM [Herbiconiux sp. SYSU D00978]|uniref:flagellar motor switch protein FliM n=1 Tax=Herbiconiux sp. SYSU D00978 TaxID=2812562 RepID=UPI0027DE44A3|nr:flagellar motor switch protein FliM [Herbiconiux sp. SYSU D00978]
MGQVGTIAATPPHVEPVDFRRPAVLTRDQTRLLEAGFDTFARQWSTQLTAKLRVVAQVETTGVVVQTYSAYASVLPETTLMAVCTFGDGARAVLQLPLSAALAWVNQMLGGGLLADAPERELTTVEEAIIRRVLADALEDVRYSFGGLLVDDLRLESLQYKAQVAQAAPTTELMVVAWVEFSAGGHVWFGTFAIPTDRILPQLGGVRRLAPQNVTELLQRAVAEVPVEVGLRLAPVTVTSDAVLGLSVGDLLPLPHPRRRALELTVEGEPLGRAALGSNGARLACVVVSAEEGSR